MGNSEEDEYGPITVGESFAGISGLGMGIKAAFDARMLWQVEIDPWCRQVLAKNDPEADRSVIDVTSPEALTLPYVDVHTTAPQCQQFSSSGKRGGIATDTGQLIYAAESQIRALRPPAVVLENVASGKTRWLPHVRLFLHALGYRTRAIELSGSQVGSPQLRNRIFVLALADTDRLRELQPRWRQYQKWRRNNYSDAPVGEWANPSGEREFPRVIHGIPIGPHARRLLEHRFPSGKGEIREVDAPRFTATKQPDTRRRIKALANTVIPHMALIAGWTMRDWIDEAFDGH